MTPLHLASLCGWLIMTRNKRRGGLKKDHQKLTKRSSKEMDLEWSSKEFQNMRVVRYSKAGPSRMPPRSQRGEASEGLILLQEWKVLPIVIHSQELLDIQLRWLLHNKLSHYFTKTFWDSWVLQIYGYTRGDMNQYVCIFTPIWEPPTDQRNNSTKSSLGIQAVYWTYLQDCGQGVAYKNMKGSKVPGAPEPQRSVGDSARASAQSCGPRRD